MEKTNSEERGNILGRLDTYFGIGNIHPTGSRVICEKPPENSDYDYLVLYTGWRLKKLEEYLGTLGFRCDTLKGSYRIGTGPFDSWRYKDINILVTRNRKFFKSWINATELAKGLKLNEKKDRIYLFQRMLYPEKYTK